MKKIGGIGVTLLVVQFLCLFVSKLTGNSLFNLVGFVVCVIIILVSVIVNLIFKMKKSEKDKKSDFINNKTEEK